MEEQTRELGDYLATLRRAKYKILGTMALLFLVSALVAFLLPPVYRSTATILIEQQEIPVDLVRSTISSYADQRIQMISQQVMTRANLMQIVQKYNLYPSYRRSKTTEELLDRLRKDIKLDILKADVIDQRNGSRTTATIAFSLTYDGETPQDAQKVANELVTLFLSENLKTRQQKTADTSAFLAEEASKLNEHISQTEATLAAFKQKNMGRLPEQTTLNLQFRDRADNEVKEVERQITALEDRKFYLQSQLAQIKPNTPMISASGERILDPNERLKVLQTQYATMSAVYSADHPDVVKMRREIRALQKETGAAGDTEERSKQLTSLRTQLATAREKYSDDHPDVVKLRKAIAALEKQAPPGDRGETAAIKPENPAFIALQSQLESTVNELKSLQVKRTELRAKIASYEARLEQSPEVEREYLDLTRDHEASLRRYQDIKAKQMQAQIGQELEKDRKGERFSLIDPPQLPEQPSSPNRPAILLLGFLVSIGGGVASTALLENLDGSVRSSKTLSNIVDVPVLSVIPYTENHGERLRRSRIVRIAFAGIVAVALLLLLLIHFFWMPLDVLWFVALRKLQMAAP